MYLVLGSWQSGSAVQSVGSMAVDVDESKIDESDYAMPNIPSLQLCGGLLGAPHRIRAPSLHGVTSPLSRLCGVKLQLDYWLPSISIERDGH